jgi:hypothetical protein
VIGRTRPFAAIPRAHKHQQYQWLEKDIYNTGNFRAGWRLAGARLKWVNNGLSP